MNINFKSDNDNTRIQYGSNGVPYISYKALDETGLVLDGFSTRLGGVSKNFLSSLNLGFKRGDNPDNVMENHRLISEAIGFDYRRLVTSDQTHTTNIRIVTEADAGKGIIRERDYSDIDGLITNCRNLPLVTYYADCVPLFILDPDKQVVGLCHSGWRGTVGKIGAKAVELMSSNFGSNPEKIIACIGPSICSSCYEIGQDVADEFKQAFPKNIQDILDERANQKYQLNLWKAVYYVFEEAGLKSQNIYLPNICTCCNKEVLFSHRGNKGKRGNLGAFLMLK